jgi:uncharacterized membrane protein YjgN (DUF898 family)
MKAQPHWLHEKDRRAEIALPAPRLGSIAREMSSVDTIAAGTRFLGARRDYWRLLTRGALLLLVTLGLYRFWLMTDVRRFLWCHTEIDGETLEYCGTPLELLLGFLVALAVLIPIYGAFFLAALDLGPIGKGSGLIGFVGLGFLGQYAIYRARRYRLSRTIYRGLRFSQTGSAWIYAIRALAWWLLTALTLGLAYPFQVASLERYKLRNTYYGNQPGRFAGSGWGLFFRGLPLWLLTVGPIAAALFVLIGSVDWGNLANAIGQDGDNDMARVEGASPGFGAAVAFSLLMLATAIAMAALLYPVFQTIVLRWWSSGLRLGELSMRSKLRIRDVYRAYMRFLGYALIFTFLLGLVSLVLGLAVAGLSDKLPDGSEVAGAALALAAYVIAALGYSTIYRATVLLSLWQLGIDALQLTGAEMLDRVEAGTRTSSALSEGLADALNVGGY